jgi:branched-chain amino acid aminotransferase
MNNIDWSSLPFGYFKTDYNVRCYFRDGKWGEIETSSSEEIVMHMAATCLHYGQSSI